MNSNTERFLRNEQTWPELPKELAAYIILDCLAQKDHVKTYLAEHRDDGTLCIVKVYTSPAQAEHEADILRGLSHPGVPQILAQVNEHIVLTYAEGSSASEARVMLGFSTDSAIELIDRLCDILSYLHGQSPPVIHRDIKPEHIIVGKDGAVSLIDFEVSRVYKQDEIMDTINALTPAFAAPEQFGYWQTDVRSDIYAVGVLLLYLLSGSIEVRKIDTLVHDRDLAQVIRRCTAFSPQDRYRDVETLRKALRLVRTQAARRRKWMAVVAAISLCVGFGLGLLYMTGMPDYAAITFKEPLIESAVRARLGMDLKTPIYQSDLDTVTELFLVGNKPAETMNEYWILSQHMEAIGIVPGNVATLSDLERMPNLEEIYMSMQQLTEVDALATLNHLRSVDLHDSNNLADISGLANMHTLELLVLGNTAVHTLEDIAGLSVEDLHINGTAITSLEPLRNNDSIRSITMPYTNIDDLSLLLTMPNLEYVHGVGYPKEMFDELRPFAFELEWE